MNRQLVRYILEMLKPTNNNSIWPAQQQNVYECVVHAFGSVATVQCWKKMPIRTNKSGCACRMITVCALYVVRGEWHEQQATEAA